MSCSTVWRLGSTVRFELLYCRSYKDLPCLAAGAEAKYAAHAGILDSARAVVNDLRKTGILRKLFRFDPEADGGPSPPPIFPSSHASERRLQTLFSRSWDFHVVLYSYHTQQPPTGWHLKALHVP